jgi:hypothetical protein
MLREEMHCEVERLQSELEHKQALRTAELYSRGEEERIQAMEFEARQRMFAIEQASIRQAATAKLRAEAAARDAALEARQRQVRFRVCLVALACPHPSFCSCLCHLDTPK